MSAERTSFTDSPAGVIPVKLASNARATPIPVAVRTGAGRAAALPANVPAIRAVNARATR